MAIDGIAPTAIPDGEGDPKEGKGFKLYPYEGYWSNLQVWRFMELSSEGGAAYKLGKDSEGEEIFQQHKKEDKKDALRRRKRSSVLNYCDFFASRFHGYVTGKRPVRVELPDVPWRRFTEDATGAGQSWADFMDEVLRNALDVSPIWVGIDTPRVDPGRYRSLQDQIDLGVRPFVYQVDPRNVVDVEWRSGVLARIVVREERRVKPNALAKETSEVDFLEWQPDMWMRWRQIAERDGSHFVVAKEPVSSGPNPWGFIPFEPVHFGRPRRRLPVFSRSMIHDCATLQRDVFRLLSLYFEELFNRTFSTMVLAGTTGDEIGTQLNQTLLVLEDPEARVAAAGADTAQAESLLESLKWLIKNMFRVAQFESSGDPADVATRSAESGKKKARDLEGLYQVLGRFSAGAQHAENRILRMYERIAGLREGTVARTAYPVDYNVQSTAELIEELGDLQLAQFPPTFVGEVKKGIMRRMRPEIPDAVWTKVEEEVRSQVQADMEAIIEEVDREVNGGEAA